MCCVLARLESNRLPRRAVCGGSCRSAVAVVPIAPSTCKGVRVLLLLLQLPRCSLHTYRRTIKIKLSWLSTGICLLTHGLALSHRLAATCHLELLRLNEKGCYLLKVGSPTDCCCCGVIGLAVCRFIVSSSNSSRRSLCSAQCNLFAIDGSVTANLGL